MRKLVESIPNFSEGRDPKVVDQIVGAICSLDGVTLLDKEMDPNHNRCVITVVGDPDAVAEGVFRGVKKASELIDLTQHKGEHPRIGATDVVPFVPIAGVTMDDCVAIAKGVAERISKELQIPTYLYEKAAQRPDRVNLEVIRKGQFEALREAIATDPNRAPDFGAARIHPTAGATVVGARGPLIAFNINLDTNDLALAKEIGKSIRASSGGFPCVKAMGLPLETRGIVQVSMNLTNFEETSIHTVFEAVKEKASAKGVKILGSEIVGLIPQKALVNVAESYINPENFSHDQILENKLAALEAEKGGATVSVAKSAAQAQAGTPVPPAASGTLALPSLDGAIQSFLSAVAAPTPAPGGGSVSAFSGASGAALGEMVCGISLKKCTDEQRKQLEDYLGKLGVLRVQLAKAFHEDATSFDAVMAAFGLPKATDEEKAKRRDAIQEATKGAAKVPLGVAKKSMEVLRILNLMRGVANPNCASDVTVGMHSARTAVCGALANVKINLDSIKDATFVTMMQSEISAIENELGKVQF